MAPNDSVDRVSQAGNPRQPDIRTLRVPKNMRYFYLVARRVDRSISSINRVVSLSSLSACLASTNTPETPAPDLQCRTAQLSPVPQELQACDGHAGRYCCGWSEYGGGGARGGIGPTSKGPRTYEEGFRGVGVGVGSRTLAHIIQDTC